MKMKSPPASSCIVLLGALLLSSQAARAQDVSLEGLLPGLRDRAVVLDITARVVDADQVVGWNAENSKVTIPGRPVGIKLVGTNIVVAVQFTPYRRNGQNYLVAQGQIWVDIPNQGISYYTTIETIPVDFGETVYFFPLGRGTSTEDSRIEIQVAMRPYSGSNEENAPVFAESPQSGGRDLGSPPEGTAHPAAESSTHRQ
jgi:hypothetical protein